MSALARLAVAVGYRVSGTDRDDSVTLAALRALGVDAVAGHRADAIPAGTATLVVSTAIAPDNPELAEAARQLEAGLALMVGEGWVHGDLSAYNLLWWDGELWFIDFPQALDLAANPQGLNFLHRDVTNVAQWFTQKGHPIDGEALFASLL